MNIIKKISLAVFNDKKLLVVRSKNSPLVFYSVGGKVEAGESDIDCLKREVKEEINCEVDESSIKFLNEFRDVAHGKENTQLVLRVYTGNLIGEPTPSSEIAEIGWFDSKTDKKHLAEIAQRQLIPWLKENSYID